MGSGTSTGVSRMSPSFQGSFASSTPTFSSAPAPNTTFGSGFNTFDSPSFAGTGASPTFNVQPTQSILGPQAQARSTSSFGGITTFAKQFGGFAQQLMGSQQQAAGYEQAAQSSLAAAEYNAQVVRVNLLRNLDALSRDIIQLSAKQKAEAASSGFSISSKSFQMITHDTLSKFEREILSQKQDAENRMNAILFEGRSQAAALETKASSARSAGFSQAAKNIPSLLQGGSTAFGGLGS